MPWRLCALPTIVQRKHKKTTNAEGRYFLFSFLSLYKVGNAQSLHGMLTSPCVVQCKSLDTCIVLRLPAAALGGSRYDR